MTSPTLERAIEAVANTASDDPGEENFEAVARAVLMAVREPESAMNAWIDCDLSEDVHPHKVFVAMIDAILAEGE